MHFCIDAQCVSAFPPTNGISDYSGMNLLLDNINHLLGKRSVNAVGVESGVGQAWLRRVLLSDRPGGTRKADQDKVAQLAQYFGVTTSELMFRDLSHSDRPESQLVGTEQEIVSAAVKLLGFLDQFAPEPPSPDTYAGRLFIAMQVAREEGVDGILSGGTIIEASRQLAVRLRAVG